MAADDIRVNCVSYILELHTANFFFFEIRPKSS